MLNIGVGAAMGVAAAGGYLAAVPATYRGASILAAEAEPGMRGAERLGALLSRTVLSDGVLIRASGAEPSADLAGLRRRLSLVPAGGLTFEVRARAADRDGAARLSNAVAEAAAAQHAGGVEAAQAGLEAGPAETTAQARAALAEAEARLGAARSPRPDAAARQALEESERQLTLARARLAEITARSDALPAALAARREPDLTAEALSSPALERLRQTQAEAMRAETSLKTTLGPLHPSVREAEEQTRTARRLYLDEVKRTARLLQDERAAAAARLSGLEEQVTLRRDAAAAMDKQIAELEAEVDARRAAVQRAESASDAALDNAAAAIPVRLIRAATAGAAERWPDPRSTLGTGLAGGALAGLFAAAFLRPRRRRDEVAGETRIEPFAEALPVTFEPPPMLLPVPSPVGEQGTAEPQVSPLQALAAEDVERAVLPHLDPAATPGGEAREILDRPESAYSEAVRLLRRRLNTRVEPSRTLTLLVVSERPSGGCSTLAANLAQAFADVARRVVLVDASAPAASAGGRAPAFSTVRHGSAMAYQHLPIVPPAAASDAQQARIAWSFIRLARSAFEVAIVDAPALEVSRLASGGADLADLALVLTPGGGPDRFATVALLEPRRLADTLAGPELRGTLAA